MTTGPPASAPAVVDERGNRAALARRTAGNAAAAAVAAALGKVATFVWLVVAARLLAPDDFGAFSYALATVLLASAVVEWGFRPWLLQQASADAAGADRAYTSTQAWHLLLGVPLYALTALGLAGTRDDDGIVLVVAAVAGATAAESWCSNARTLAAARQQQRAVSGALTAQRLLTAVVVAGALAVEASLVVLAVSFMVGTLTGVPLHSVALHRVGGRLDRDGLRLRSLRAALGASHVLGLSALALVALARIDQVLIGVLVDDAAVASYAVAYRLLDTVLFVAFALRSAVVPVLAADPRHQVVRTALEHATTALALVYVPYAVVCVTRPGPVLDLLFGEPYGETAAGSLALLSLTPLLFAVAYLGTGALQAVRRERGILVAALAALGLNVVLNLLLIPPFGGTGAAAATVVSYAVQAVVVVAVLARLGRRPRFVRASALALAAGAPLAAVMLAPLPLVAALPVGGVVYLLVWAGLGVWLAPDQVRAGVRVLPAPVRRRLLHRLDDRLAGGTRQAGRQSSDEEAG